MGLLDPGSCISASAAPSYDGLTLGSWAMPYPCGPLSCLYVSPANSCDIRDIFFSLSVAQPCISSQVWCRAWLASGRGQMLFWGFSPRSRLLSVLVYNLTWFQDQVIKVTLLRAKKQYSQLLAYKLMSQETQEGQMVDHLCSGEFPPTHSS